MSQLLQYYNSFSQRTGAANPTSAPTFEDLSIDDSLTELQRLVRYTKSSIGLQRCVTFLFCMRELNMPNYFM